jgi:hypothetical protein
VRRRGAWVHSRIRDGVISGGPERDVDPGADDAADDRIDDRHPRVVQIRIPLPTIGRRQHDGVDKRRAMLRFLQRRQVRDDICDLLIRQLALNRRHQSLVDDRVLAERRPYVSLELVLRSDQLDAERILVE